MIIRILDMIQGSGHQFWSFIRDKFEILLLCGLFVFVFIHWAYSGYKPEVKEVLMLILTAFVALMRIVPGRTTNIQTDTVNAQTIDTANTDKGDIVTSTDPENVSRTGSDTPIPTKSQSKTK